MVSRTFKRIKISFRTPIATTGNGPVAGGKINNLLVLGTLGTEKGKHYLVKSLRGLVNHSMMTIAQQKGLEVCHSSRKTETQEGENLLPEGFHPNGACYPDDCIKHRLMGSIHQQSILRFLPVIINSEKQKSKDELKETNKVHIATNKHNTLMHKSRKAIQDYGERYFAGEFTLIIELLRELTPLELGFLLEAILYAPEIGFGAKTNNGSGALEVLSIKIQQVTRTRTINGEGIVKTVETERNQWNEMEGALKKWAEL